MRCHSDLAVNGIIIIIIIIIFFFFFFLFMDDASWLCANELFLLFPCGGWFCMICVKPYD